MCEGLSAQLLEGEFGEVDEMEGKLGQPGRRGRESWGKVKEPGEARRILPWTPVLVEDEGKDRRQF